MSLLLHAEVRWLLGGNVLTCPFEVLDEVCIALSNALSPRAHHITDPKWMASLAYLAGLFDTHTLNSSLQPQQRYPDPLRRRCFHE